MNKKEIAMQKEVNVKSLLCIYFIVFLVSFSFSQNKLEGEYKIVNKLNDFSEKYFFTKSNTFKYEYHGDLGLIQFGNGEYFIKKDSLILNYNLTELKEESYHRIKKYYNSKDSIIIKLNIYNFKSNPIYNSIVYAYPNNISTESDKNGKAVLKFKKGKKKIELQIDGEYLAKQIIYIHTNANYTINAYMNKNEIIGFNHPKAIKNEIVKYKIIDITEGEIKL
ncbi:hypothetical protein, partial [Tenacibaculum ovolyticum]|uniref:hypothetical protein n=1 Tax=Tenacibaculum ovolyticum TaxID=104270 RepID=UPI0012F75BF3